MVLNEDKKPMTFIRQTIDNADIIDNIHAYVCKAKIGSQLKIQTRKIFKRCFLK